MARDIDENGRHDTTTFCRQSNGIHLQARAMGVKQGHVEDDGQASARPEAAGSSAPVFDAGDFNSVYATWYDDVTRWIRALCADVTDPDDLAQEVFIVVHRRLHAFDGRNMAGWLYRIAIRQIRDFRRLRWIKNIFKRSVPLTSRIVSPSPTPLMALETQERQDLLERLLAHLSEPLRATFVLFEIEGYTSEEIAAFHQISVNTVRARIHRARKKLLGLLAAWRNDVRQGGG